MAKNTKPVEETKEYPVLTSMGITNSENGWVFYVMKTQNDKVLSVDYSQDNLRGTVIDQFKIAAHKEFMED